MKLAFGFIMVMLTFANVAQADMTVEYVCNHWNPGKLAQQMGDFEILRGPYPGRDKAIRFPSNPEVLMPARYSEFGNILTFDAGKVEVQIQWFAGAGHLKGNIYLNVPEEGIFGKGVEENRIICSHKH